MSEDHNMRSAVKDKLGRFSWTSIKEQGSKAKNSFKDYLEFEDEHAIALPFIVSIYAILNVVFTYLELGNWTNASSDLLFVFMYTSVFLLVYSHDDEGRKIIGDKLENLLRTLWRETLNFAGRLPDLPRLTTSPGQLIMMSFNMMLIAGGIGISVLIYPEVASQVAALEMGWPNPVTTIVSTGLSTMPLSVALVLPERLSVNRKLSFILLNLVLFQVATVVFVMSVYLGGI